MLTLGDPGKVAILLQSSYHRGGRSVPGLEVMVILRAYGDIDRIANLFFFFLI